MVTFQDYCCPSPSPWAPVDPHLHSRPSNTRRWLWVSFLWSHCSFPLSLGACKVLFVPSKTGVCFPSVVEVLWKQKSNSTCLQGQIPWGFPVPLSGPQTGKLDTVFWTFTQQWENFFDVIVCGSPTQWVWDLSLLWLCCSYHLALASSLSLDMGYLFRWIPEFSCRWLFSSWLWFWCSRRRWLNASVLHHLEPEACFVDS